MIIATENGRVAIMNHPLPIMQRVGIRVLPDGCFGGTDIDTILLNPRNEFIVRHSLHSLTHGWLTIKALFSPESTLDGQLCFSLSGKGDE